MRFGEDDLTKCWAADAQPSLPPGVSAEDWKLTDEILRAFWPGEIPWRGTAEKGIEFTYGEVTALGVRQLAEAMFTPRPGSSSVSSSSDAMAEEVVFFDLGSGVGRMTAQVFLDHTFVVRAVGVELSRTRHEVAAAALRSLVESVPAADGIRFVNGDALTADWRDATHLYISSLCFPEEVTTGITDRITSGAAPRLVVVAALTDLRNLELSGWSKTVLVTQMTWGSARVRVYFRYAGG